MSNLINKSGSFTTPVTPYNRTATRAKQVSDILPAGKTSAASSVEEAIQKADIIFLMVTDNKASEGIAMVAMKSSGCIRNKLYVDCSTIALETDHQDRRGDHESQWQLSRNASVWYPRPRRSWPARLRTSRSKKLR